VDTALMPSGGKTGYAADGTGDGTPWPQCHPGWDDCPVAGLPSDRECWPPRSARQTSVPQAGRSGAFEA